MYWLIEDEINIKTLTTIGLEEAYIEIIPSSPSIHPAQTHISCIYVKPLNGGKGYMISSNHGETFHIENILIREFIDSIKNIYVYDKKQFFHYFYHNSVFSLNFLNPSFESHLTVTHNYFYNKYPSESTINDIIPIVKHYESCEINFQNLRDYMGKEINPFYNKKATTVFYMLEANGIKVNPTLYKQYFNQDTTGYVFTQYKLNTTTTRPSNSFGGINFAALNKKNGERECFIPRNDFFIEMDISAYHPTLLAHLLDYDWDNDDIHQSFAEMYGVDYSKAKELTFQQLYGGIRDEYKELPFFKKVNEYINKTWEIYNTEGQVSTPISNHVFKKEELKDMNPQKLLNYILQNLETSTNVLILWDIFKVLKGKNTKLVLYVYDSFLLDVDKTEKDTIKQITEIFKKYKLNIKAQKGYTYKFN